MRNSMQPVSILTSQEATKKHQKIHRLPSVISRKVVACQELLNVEHKKLSARKAAELLNVPNSTMQSWIQQINSDKLLSDLAKFLSTPTGSDFLQRSIITVMKLLKCGPSGIRGMQEYLRNTGLAHFVASSEGALQNFWSRCEDYILNFGEREEKRLAKGMEHRKITVALDEMFRKGRPCLVAIEAVSNYILLEKFTEDRKADTWQKEITERLKEIPVEIGQVVSDLCGAIRACTEALGAKHIPELFHAQHEISKATSAALVSQERATETLFNEAEKKLKEMKQKPRRLEVSASTKQKLEIEEAEKARDITKIELETRTKRRNDVKGAIRELGKIHHPIDLETGKLQTVDSMAVRFNEQFTIIQSRAEEAKLTESCFDRIEKAKRAFDWILSYLKYFFIIYRAFIDGMKLNLEHEKVFNEIFFPLCYLKMIWKRLSKPDKEKYIFLLKSLEASARDGPWPEELKEEWMKKGRELAEMFQRSSSCVEGRNGMLSLNHHRFHRLNARSLKALTIMHNFDTRRRDGTTAAERFFGAKHENLFEALVANVKIPGRPQQQNRKMKELFAA
jgi:hypothetical protein